LSKTSGRYFTSVLERRSSHWFDCNQPKSSATRKMARADYDDQRSATAAMGVECNQHGLPPFAGVRESLEAIS